MNDIKLVFKNSQFLLYADDLKCYKLISNANPCQDKNELQTDIDCLGKWCDNNLMSINMDKSFTISFSKRLILIYCYTIGNQEFVRVHHIRDLGLIFDSNVCFNNYISEVISKSLRMLGFAMRSASCFRSLSTLKVLYFSLVRYLFETLSVIYVPFYTFYMVRIERIQNRFFRFAAKQIGFPFDRYTHEYSIFYINLLERR